MATVKSFEKKARETLEKKGIKTLSLESLLWFEREVKKAITTSTLSTVKDFGVQRSKFYPGQLVLYQYSAKYADELPYWDAMPLILVTSFTEKGWYGINLHYMPPRIRTWILNALYDVNTRKNMLERDRMKMNWKIAQAAARAVGSEKHLNHSIKQYLASHAKSVPLVIDPAYWDMVVFLPLARFKKGKPY